MASADKDTKIWAMFSLVATLGAAAVAKKVVDRGWRLATGKTPPANPADPDVALREAVAWAVLSGTVVAVARMLATRRAASYYQRSTGALPASVRKAAK